MKKNSSFNSIARERLLIAADDLFSRRGFHAVTLRDIAAEIGIRHASLYHHAPGGKEELFIEVMERTFDKHKNGLNLSLTDAESDLRSQLRSIARWLLAHPPLDLVRLTHSDLPAVNSSDAKRLSELAYESMIVPVIETVVAAQQSGEIKSADAALIAGAFVGMIESLHAVPAEEEQRKTKIQMADELIDIWLNGLKTTK